MGLDQYSYVVKRHEKNTDFSIYWFEDGVLEDLTKRSVALISEWRKHPYLQGWMENLFNRKADYQNFEGVVLPGGVSPHITVNAVGMNPDGSENELTLEMSKALNDAISKMQEHIKELGASEEPRRMFNNQPLRLTLSDLEQLETAIVRGELPVSSGFFWGEDSSQEYKSHDLAFVRDAIQAIENGMDVYYDSSW